ncbi:MAG: GNAT family N-acetyltransferase [Saprospiraceae bacterium]|nr:GNAT family N-acetyltransferase [Saprospiraceae bacterium]
MNIPEHLQLDGACCSLVTMRPAHLPVLQEIARDINIWQHLPIAGWDTEVFWQWGLDALKQKDAGTAHPLVVVDKRTGQLLGATRFQEIVGKHRKMEIGWTWLSSAVWGGTVNLQAKMLMLDYAFEQLGMLRVGFKTDEYNLRSQKALEKIGARFEGLQRKHMVRPDGSHRNSCFFSITDDDWPVARLRIVRMLEERRKLSVPVLHEVSG